MPPVLNLNSGHSSGFDLALTSAPASISTFTAAAWFSSAAYINDVWPCVSSAMLTLAPATRSCLTVAGSPVRAAVIRTDSPFGNVALASAPAFSRASTTAALPVSTARRNGPTP